MTKITFYLTALFFILGFNPQTEAAPYLPQGDIKVVSHTASAGNDRRTVRQEWLIRPGQSQGREITLSCHYSQPDYPLFCRVFIGQDGTVKRLNTWGREQQNDNHLLVDPGSPAPMDIVPVSQVEQEMSYQQKKKAAGRIFIRNYRVVTEKIKRAAVKDEWLRTTPGQNNFKKVMVYNRQDELVSFQLWPVDGNWWLYEETPFRRSWRINQ